MIVVTGGNGVLGRALAEELRQSPQDVRILGRRDVDLRDVDATHGLFRELQPALVYHLAGRVHGLMGNRTYPAEMFTENIRINTNVIDCAVRVGCRRIVAASTVAIYSSDVAMPVKEESIWNGAPHSGEAAYAHAKRAMLAHLDACHQQFGLSFAYPIFTNMYGPHDRFDQINGHVIPALIAKCHLAVTEGRPLAVWGTGAAERDFLSARDAARALVIIAEKHQGPINVASGKTVRINELVEILKRHSGVGRIDWDPSKPDGQLLRRYDISKLDSLGFVPRTSLENGLAETFSWYKAHFPNVRD